MPKKPRKKSVRLEKAMIAEAGGVCAWCRKPETVQVHHIDGDPANTVETNLIALCLTCHTNAEHTLQPSAADLHTRKLELLYARQRSGAPIEGLSPRKSRKTIFNATHNSGPVHQAKKMTVNYRSPKRPVLAPAPDSIAAHAAERSYIAYLRGEYLRCRLLEAKYDSARAQHPARLQNAFKQAIGCDPLAAPIGHFDAVWRRAHTAVCKTVGAVKYQGGFRPHDWEKHKQLLAEEL